MHPRPIVHFQVNEISDEKFRLHNDAPIDQRGDDHWWLDNDSREIHPIEKFCCCHLKFPEELKKTKIFSPEMQYADL